MKYLITGAAGFIGSNLCKRLALAGNEILALDNFSSYYSSQMKEFRVKEILSPVQVNVIRMDLLNREKFHDEVKKFQPEVVIHLAAHPGVRTPMSGSYQYIQNNLVAFSNVLQIAVEESVPNFLYASSSSVYGNSTEYPYNEDDQSLCPISVYGATKLANEMLIPAYVSRSNTKARGLRFFTAYGPWGRPDMSYFRIINSILNDRHFTKFGGGEVKRDFTFVDDISTMVEILANDLSARKAGYFDIVNIGGGNPHSLNDLIDIVSRKLGKYPEIVPQEFNPSDTNFTIADVTKLEFITKARPQTDLETGIEATIAWALNATIAKNMDNWVSSSS